MSLQTARGGGNWMLPVGVAAGFMTISTALIVWTPYAVFPLLFGVIPVACLALLIVLLIASVRKRKQLQISAALAFAVLAVISLAVLRLRDPVRESLRWLLWSNSFKAELKASRNSEAAELKHIEWEATGFGGVANDTLYLVFDPNDILDSAAHSGKPGRYTGLPCEVLKVRRLEAHWYSVRFYTDEHWGVRNQLDCSSILSL
jgi:hypothetical protein